jgi:hypothetical protein
VQTPDAFGARYREIRSATFIHEVIFAVKWDQGTPQQKPFYTWSILDNGCVVRVPSGVDVKNRSGKIGDIVSIEMDKKKAA